MTNSKTKVAVYLVYFSLIGILIDFFTYMFGSFSFSAGHGKVEDKLLITACTDGTVPGGGACIFFAFVVLIVGLITDLIITIKLTKQENIPTIAFILAIILGALNFITAFICLGIFFSYGASMVDGQYSYDSSTVSTPGDFWFLYIGAFEAGAAALIGGIIGLVGLKEGSYYYRSSRSYSSRSSGYSGTNASRVFRVGDEIAYHGITNLIYSEGVIQPEDKFRVLEIGTYGTNKITRLSDGMIFSNVRLSIFVLSSVGSTPVTENSKPVATVASTPNESTSHESAPKNEKSEKEKIEILKEYKELLDSGIITQEEFDKKKKELLDI